ncbi:hypothetical protein VOLCADRAFT_85944 [Volvox carteri f. nagariensis]|uniref:Signal peptide peptidase n=1 Tax=Volvox carteri f. nagariensis TaxID=3068 RepID=D8THE7_VOLCA|nr:uncharacterized protein VOLCADRAFT_85944 [Volvox carteri f. nagariensis]EFJ53057.1 hypothetical protein VOLCADRAFT_85944 [Volvox carteri f. nagariensis]|eukprot:XP_002946062.1 hypothetical protein VOLCADRAFT_85944 [Volvox carteri f. nagariensis]
MLQTSANSKCIRANVSSLAVLPAATLPKPGKALFPWRGIQSRRQAPAGTTPARYPLKALQEDASGISQGVSVATTSTDNGQPANDAPAAAATAAATDGASEAPSARTAHLEGGNGAAVAANSNSSKSQSDDHGAWRWEESDDAVRAYGSLVALLALGNLPVLHGTKLADLPYFVGLAIVTIYIGAHRGLTTRQRQQISIKEGILAPVLASVSLFGFYLLIKYLPDFNVKAFLNAYFWMLGTFAIGGAAVPVLRKVGGPLGELNLKFKLPEGLLLDEDGASITEAEAAPTDLLAVALALGLSSAELLSGHTSFTLNNLVATLVATDILQLIGPRSFRTAGLLLLGLLLYDVFWVFGSPKVVGDNVMLAVATSDMVSGPTRILFPRTLDGGSTVEAAAAAFPYSLLGLGDIAIPGLLACLALRYDASRSTDMRARAVAAAEAITSALAALEPGATSRQIADATADAAEAAYDRIADQEARQRTASLDGTNAAGHGSGGGVDHSTAAAAAAAAAAATRGASLLLDMSTAAAGGSATRASARTSRGASISGRSGGDSNPTPDAKVSKSSNTSTASFSQSSSLSPPGPDVNGSGTSGLSPQGTQPRLPVSEAVLYQRKYFTAVMFAYVLGLVGAFIANDVTGLGQPALLYIVPTTLGAVVLTGVRRDELGRLWSFTDVPSYGLQQGKAGTDGTKGPTLGVAARERGTGRG